eukprot:CAMPEP_0194448732 /NCGR_PEP_ID=MMETSP0176-20130528/129736_1 /TAXON_ID=216777 /ORGANISM="Proboscia alata, Strain PI-D3" /LENGTH=1530 /DNA_ID=CAMNT_0039275753 /DNA_START=147 /DNA_END=4740 /DNA_ORIENTATION=-
MNGIISNLNNGQTSKKDDDKENVEDLSVETRVVEIEEEHTSSISYTSSSDTESSSLDIDPNDGRIENEHEMNFDSAESPKTPQDKNHDDSNQQEQICTPSIRTIESKPEDIGSATSALSLSPIPQATKIKLGASNGSSWGIGATLLSNRAAQISTKSSSFFKRAAEAAANTARQQPPPLLQLLRKSSGKKYSNASNSLGSCDGGKVSLAFDDYTDLQTRLQLLPLENDTCVGAVVALFTPPRSLLDSSSDLGLSSSCGANSKYDFLISGVVINAQQHSTKKNSENKDQVHTATNEQNMYNNVVVEEEFELLQEGIENWMQKDFSDILSICREMKGGIQIILSVSSLPTEVDGNTCYVKDDVRILSYKSENLNDQSGNNISDFGSNSVIDTSLDTTYDGCSGSYLSALDSSSVLSCEDNSTIYEDSNASSFEQSDASEHNEVANISMGHVGNGMRDGELISVEKEVAPCAFSDRRNTRSGDEFQNTKAGSSFNNFNDNDTKEKMAIENMGIVPILSTEMKVMDNQGILEKMAIENMGIVPILSTVNESDGQSRNSDKRIAADDFISVDTIVSAKEDEIIAAATENDNEVLVKSLNETRTKYLKDSTIVVPTVTIDDKDSSIIQLDDGQKIGDDINQVTPAIAKKLSDEMSPNLSDRLSRWGYRVRSTTNLIAIAVSDAASEATSAAGHGGQKKIQLIDGVPNDHNNLTCESLDVCICVQTLKGSVFGFTPCDESSTSALHASTTVPVTLVKNSPATYGSKNHPAITNSSLLVVRKLPDFSPCPNFYRFQWYSSKCSLSPVACSQNPRQGATTEKTNSGYVDDECTDGTLEWQPLEGATFPSFQPSAIDIGKKLRCTVFVPNDDIMAQMDCGQASTSDDVETSSKCLLSSPDSKSSLSLDSIESVSCSDSSSAQFFSLQTSRTVSADSTLFNAARQLILGGATFGNLMGKGPAEGREFKVKVEIGLLDSSKSLVTYQDMSSFLTIFQVSGSTAESLCSAPIPNITAEADYLHQRLFNLTLPPNLDDDNAAMVIALSVNKKMMLSAPTRVSRESFLLALGIANFKGKPCDLCVNSVLYPDSPCQFALDKKVVKECSNDEIRVVDNSSLEKNSQELMNINRCGNSDFDCDSVRSSIPAGHTPSPITSRSLFLDNCPSQSLKAVDGNVDCNSGRIEYLETNLKKTKKVIVVKDKIIHDLQRRLRRFEDLNRTTKGEISNLQNRAELAEIEYKKCSTSLKLAERRNETHEANLSIAKKCHIEMVATLEVQISSHGNKLVENEKQIKSLQNENAVLSAAVDARDRKLSVMKNLEQTVQSLSQEVRTGQSFRKESEIITSKYNNLQLELVDAKESEEASRSEMRSLQKTLHKAEDRFSVIEAQANTTSKDFDAAQTLNHKLKMERNSFKQKSDSLSKEMSRICRSGLNIYEIEKIIREQKEIQQELSLLRAGKRQAEDEVVRVASELDRAMNAQEKLGLKGEALRAIEQKSSLEQVISNLTEHLNAKEMQIETMKQVNMALSEELHAMAKANMGQSDI